MTTARPTSTPRNAGLFKLSLLYLFLHYGALLVEAALKPYGLGGW